MNFVPLCRLDELTSDRKTVFLDDGDAVLVIRHAGKLHAIDGHCPHQFAPLEGGEIDSDGVLTCPMHGWRFRIDDGKSPDNPWNWLTAYHTRVDDHGNICIARRHARADAGA